MRTEKFADLIYIQHTISDRKMKKIMEAEEFCMLSPFHVFFFSFVPIHSSTMAVLN